MYLLLQFSLCARQEYLDFISSPFTFFDGGGHLFDGFALCVVNMAVRTGAFTFTPMNVHINLFLN